MRLQHALVALLFTLSCAERIGLRHGLRVRQNNNAATTTNDAPTSTATSNDNTSGSTSPEPTHSASRTATDNGDASSTDSQSADATSPITVTGTATDMPVPTSTLLPGVDNSTTPNDLPIHPQLNPPLGIGGVVLILTGLGLGLVGIKHRPTQTFLSTSLLVALGCEVLVVYLMHPPVPVAIQGAYLIAGIAGGCLLGGLALIFKEMSEGFGCVLGGFCFAMWLLVLSPGGLIKNSVGKIILIAILCVACYSLYISRFTRVYGLIFCTSFAGATAFIIGVDCFTNAGLKEFWLYIWDLNDNIFPLFTDSYPITRNMRAEIAAIIIVAFIGTMSQIKIWKIVKEGKAKRDAQRIADEEARDAEEAEVGRDVEDRNRQSLAQWEGDYDGKKQPQVHVDSGIGSVEDFSEPTTKRASKRYSLPMLKLDKDGRNHHSSSSSNLLDFNKRSSGVPSLPPFSFGDDDTGSNTHSATVATTPRTEPISAGFGGPEAPVKDRRGVAVKRLSLMSLQAKEAMEAAEDETPFIEEEEDLQSSVAATAADPPDLDALSVRLSRPNSMYLSYAEGTSPLQTQEQFIEDDDDEALYPAKSATGGSSPGLPKSPGTPGLPGQGSEIAEGSGDATGKTNLEDRLPKRVSKAAATYRTNEWAKEVSRAEPEPIEETLEHDSDAVQIEMGNAAQSARAEENNAAPAPPPPPPEPKQQKPKQSKHIPRSPSGAVPTPIYAHARGVSEDSWSVPLAKRASSNPILAISTPEQTAEAPVPTRNVSAPVLDLPFVDSPLETTPQRSRPTSTMPKAPNLLDERRDRMEKRLTTTSFMALSPGLGITPTFSEGSVGKVDSHEGSQGSKTSISEPINEEDMTLAERKAMVQQQAQSTDSLTQSRHASVAQMAALQQQQQSQQYIPQPKPVRISSSSNQRPIYDSHQPRRTSNHNTNKQAVNWTQWRSSNAVATNSRNPYVIGDNQMEILRAVRMQSETEAKIREQQKQAMQEQIDAHMRMGGMHDAHRAALSKMQGKANKNAK